MTNHYYNVSLVRQLQRLIDHKWFYKGGSMPLTVEKLVTDSLGALDNKVLVPDGSHGLEWGLVPNHGYESHEAHGVRVTRESSQTIGDSTVTSIEFTAEVFDNEGHFTANSTNVITSQAGLWIAGGGIDWEINTAGPRRYVAIFADGVEAEPVEWGETGFGPNHRQSVVTLQNWGANVTLTLRCFQDTGGDLLADRAWFWMGLLGVLP